MADRPAFATRPLGITIIAFVTLLFAFGNLVSLRQAPLPESAPADLVRHARQVAFWAGTWSAVGLVAAAGLFAMRPWGLFAAVVFYAAMIPLAFVRERMLNPTESHAFYLIFWIGLAALIIWHLTSRDTRALFRRKA